MIPSAGGRDERGLNGLLRSSHAAEGDAVRSQPVRLVDKIYKQYIANNTYGRVGLLFILFSVIFSSIIVAESVRS